jgi:hypothetical protein
MARPPQKIVITHLEMFPVFLAQYRFLLADIIIVFYYQTTQLNAGVRMIMEYSVLLG